MTMLLILSVLPGYGISLSRHGFQAPHSRLEAGRATRCKSINRASPRHSCHRAVAMFVFLAGAARAGLVAADLAMDRPLLRRVADKRFDGVRAGGAENRLGGSRAKNARGGEGRSDRAARRRGRIGTGNLERLHRRRAVRVEP